LRADRVVNRGGSYADLAPFPALAPFPVAAEAQPGSADLNVPANTTRELASPASFRKIIVESGATLRLLGGRFDLIELEVRPRARVEAAAPVDIRLAKSIVTGMGTYVGPAPGANLSAKDVLVQVEGSGPLLVQFGDTADIRARILAPRGPVTFLPRARFRGAIAAAFVLVGDGTRIDFEDGLPELPCPPGCGPEGASCDDGNACTEGDRCQAGQCVPGAPKTCAPGDACHHPGTCDKATGVCSNPPKDDGTSCGDGNACNGAEICAQGACSPGTPPVLDDGNPCTIDRCDPLLGVIHDPAPMGADCRDGNACNGAETCDGAGVCKSGVAPNPDDNNPCTIDGCDPAMGVFHTPVDPGTNCSDGNACNGLEQCNGAGMCLSGTPPPIDDGNPCTADSCDPAIGPIHPPIEGSVPCSDGNACNGLVSRPRSQHA